MRGLSFVLLGCLLFLPSFRAPAETEPSSHAVHSRSHRVKTHVHTPNTHDSLHGDYGPYPLHREASGTSWQPDSAPHPGMHVQVNDWRLMLHAFANDVYDHQGGKRGDEQFFSQNWIMAMAQHPLGPGVFGVRTMLSLEPVTIGDSGYPLLLQTGETSNGRPLIDRQHPHDFLMELSTSYSIPFGQESSIFAYFGMPGEPAIGPPSFMHRFSGMDNPEAPILHHWLDSTHITFGVATLGYTWRGIKLDGSLFTGREPDENRWDFDDPKFDSYSGRLTVNPTRNWSVQASYGWLHSPEQFEPEVDIERYTFSVIYHRNWGSTQWMTTLALGRNSEVPGPTLDGGLLESAIHFHQKHTVFARFERAEKNHLFLPEDPLHDRVFTVNKASLGYVHDFPEWHRLRTGIGGVGSISILPDSLTPHYGENPLSFMVFVRIKL